MNGTEITIPVPWGHIAGKSWGNANSQKLLAIHGLQDNCGVFDRLIRTLKGDYYIIAIDLPGHGLSSHFPPGLPLHFLNCIITVKKVIDHIKWDHFYFLGHSLGGQIGLFFSAVFPVHVKKLIVIDHYGPKYVPDRFLGDSIDLTLNQFMDMEKRLEKGIPPVYTYDEAKDKLMNRDSFLTKEAADIVLKRSLIPVDGNRYKFCMDQRLKLNPFPACTDELMKQIIVKIKCPVLMLMATQRSEIYEKTYKEIIPTYKDKKKFIFKIVDGNHDVHQNEPEKVAGIIDKFFLDQAKL